MSWAQNTTYIIGQRVSANGNAYQVTTGGTSALTGGGPSSTSSSISDGSVTWKYLSAINYNSLGSWTSSIPSTLSQPIVGLLWNDGPITTTSGTAFFSLTGHTTTVTNNITLKAAPGESFRDKLVGQTTALSFNSGNGVSFVLPTSGSGNTAYIYVTDANVNFFGLQFQDPNQYSNSNTIQVNGGAAVIIDSCIFDGYGQNGTPMILLNSVGAVLRNNLIVDRVPNTGRYTYICTTSQNTRIANNTNIGLNNPAYGNAYFQSSTTASMLLTNTIVMGYSPANGVLGNTGSTCTIQYSLFSNAYAGMYPTNGAGNIFSQALANQFVNPVNDFRIKTGSVAINAGTTDTTDIPTAIDIVGTTRPQGTTWDIGAWEVFVSAPSVALIGVVSTGAVGSPAVAIPTHGISGVVGFGYLGTLSLQNIQTLSSMYVFTDGNMLLSSQLNQNFGNTIDKSTATPQNMNASLNIGGTVNSANISTTGLLAAQGGQIVAVNTFAQTGNYSMQPTDYILIVNKVVPQTTTIILPSFPSSGRVYTVQDGTGNCNTYPITILANQNIANYSTYILNIPFSSVSFVFSGTQWLITSNVGSFDGTFVTMQGASRTSNTVSGSGAAALGANNMSSGANALTIGASNTASGAQSLAIGNNSTASNTGSMSLGIFANDRGRYGQYSFANARLHTNSGDSQYGLTTLRATIAASTTGRLTADGNTAGTTNICNLPNGIAYGFGRIIVTAFDSVNNKAAMWYVDNLLVLRGTTVGSTTIVGSPTITLVQASASLSALTNTSITVAADTTYGGINLSLVNGTSVSLDAVAIVETSEVF
jgi:hypothetical protein